MRLGALIFLTLRRKLILEELRELATLQAEFPGRRAELVGKARAQGVTWRQIAEILGMTQHGLIKANAVYVTERVRTGRNPATDTYTAMLTGSARVGVGVPYPSVPFDEAGGPQEVLRIQNVDGLRVDVYVLIGTQDGPLVFDYALEATQLPS